MSIRPPSYHHIDEQFGYKPQITPAYVLACAQNAPARDDAMIIESSESAPEDVHAGWDFEKQTRAAYEGYNYVDFGDESHSCLVAHLPWNDSSMPSQEEAAEMDRYFDFDS